MYSCSEALRHDVFDLLMHTVHEDTSLKVTKYFAHGICSYIICISNNFLKAPCSRILKSNKTL